MAVYEIHELTDNEIKQLLDKFAYSTEVAIKAGYNGIEIHGANNYFIQQIYSPFSNERNDEWEAVIIKEWISHYK